MQQPRANTSWSLANVMKCEYVQVQSQMAQGWTNCLHFACWDFVAVWGMGLRDLCGRAHMIRLQMRRINLVEPPQRESPKTSPNHNCITTHKLVPSGLRPSEPGVSLSNKLRWEKLVLIRLYLEAPPTADSTSIMPYVLLCFGFNGRLLFPSSSILLAGVC